MEIKQKAERKALKQRWEKSHFAVQKYHFKSGQPRNHHFSK
jgi:hypothetical protein